MRLTGFKIQNVKSIKDTDWCHLSDHDNITVFAGQNEAGKSAILEALNFFRNGSTPEFERLSKRADDLHPYVECEFLLEEGDFDGDPDVANIIGKLSTVRLYRGDVAKDDYAAIKMSPELLQTVDAEIEKLARRHQDEDEVRKANAAATAAVPPSAPAPAVAPVAAPAPVPVAAAIPPFDGDGIRKTILQHILNHLPEFIYYDSFSSILPGSVKLAEITNFKAIDDFQKVFHIDFAEVLKKGVQARSSELFKAIREATVDLNSYWKQKQTTQDDDHYQYDIHLNPNVADPAQSTVEFLIHRNDGVSLFVEQKSKGFQWFSSFNLRLKALGVEASNAHKFIILIDEPGQGLHETAQADVKAVLEELGTKGMQIAYTTHNPCLIGVTDEEILRIRLVFQTREDGTKIKNIAQFSSSEGSLDALSPIITAMGINSVGQILDRTVPAIALEGITDHYYLTAMKKVLGITDNYSFVPAVGVPNVRHLISILIGWGNNYKAVFDGDKMGKSVYNDLKKHLYPDEETEFKKHVYMLENAEGIEDLFSPGDFDTHVIGSARSDQTLKNSAIAKTKKKELSARLFLEKVNTAGPISLSAETKANFKKVFDWLKGSTTPVAAIATAR